MVAKFLKVPQLIDQHGMTKMQIRCCRIKAGFDSQRTAGFKFFLKLCLNQQLFRTALNQCELQFNISHA